MSRPNFLFFITDQQRYDHVGYAGNRVLKTPNIDSMAARGSWLPNFYVSSPTCMSSRATLMTGRVPSVNGVRFNGIPLDLDSVTFVDLLRAHGYRTALIGKSHLQGMLEAPSMATRKTHPDGLSSPPEAFKEAKRPRHDPAQYSQEMQEVWARTPDMGERINLPFYGFDHVEFCTGHGDQVAGHYRDWVKRETDGKFAQGIEHARQTSDVGAPQVYEPALSEDLYPTRFIQNRTIEYLENHAKESQAEPFFIQCSFPDPHHPFTPPGEYYQMYSPDDVDLPESFFAPNKDATPPVRLLWDEYESGSKSKRWTWPFVTGEAEARDITAKTFGQITMIDDAIGQVLAALDRLGLRESTVLCFFSDHGDYLGDHGLMLKGPMHYQSIIRVPFLWSDPDSHYHRGRVESLGSVLDLAKTVLYRAGIEPYNGIQGEDLLSVFQTGDPSRSLLIETTTQYPFLGFDDLVSVTTLVNARWRLSVWQDCEWGELYDLENDPWELNNLWAEEKSSEIRGQLLHQLVKLMQDHVETSPFPLSVS